MRRRLTRSRVTMTSSNNHQPKKHESTGADRSHSSTNTNLEQHLQCAQNGHNTIATNGLLLLNDGPMKTVAVAAKIPKVSGSR